MRNSVVVFLILTVSFAATFSSATFFLLSQRPSQAYMTMGVYSESGLLNYTESNSTVLVSQLVNWTLSVGNRMGTAQLVMIVVRLGNSSLSLTSLPPSASCFPVANASSAATCFPQVAAIRHIVGDGDTANLDFDWSVGPGSNQTGLNLEVNGVSFNSKPVGAASGDSFRWIFELWTYNPGCADPSSNSCYHYGYGPESNSEAVWLQVWF
ncbi:hypothetical protein J2P12_07845, partial [Candidatus Bathyarchaeota archaeon]|nr:hypothetical protein [Candidatus Bathyarchaeota archaeon]